jgi:hypothetical protein
MVVPFAQAAGDRADAFDPAELAGLGATAFEGGLVDPQVQRDLAGARATALGQTDERVGALRVGWL